MIHAVRAATVFASDHKAFMAWQRTTAQREVGLTGEALESAVMRLAHTNPEYVVVGT